MSLKEKPINARSINNACRNRIRRRTIAATAPDRQECTPWDAKTLAPLICAVTPSMRRPSGRFHMARRIAHLENSSSGRSAVSYNKLAKRQQEIWAFFNPVAQYHVKLCQELVGNRKGTNSA